MNNNNDNFDGLIGPDLMIWFRGNRTNLHFKQIYTYVGNHDIFETVWFIKMYRDDRDKD